MFLSEVNSQLTQIYFQILKGGVGGVVYIFIGHAICLSQAKMHIVKDKHVLPFFIKFCPESEKSTPACT
jgi:hypothetical protein